jgi:diacylglycerol kinase family enzyme
VFVVVNERAGGGKAARRWPGVEQELRRCRPDVEVSLPRSADDVEKRVRQAVDAGHDAVVAAGGDGSVHLVLNALMDPATDRPRQAGCALGGIGLGSSNDFHKPFAEDRRLDAAPARIDVAAARLVDVGKATMLLSDGTRHVQYFLINASMGILAEGNHSFNTARGLTAWLKPRNVEAAIVVTAVRNIATFRPINLALRGGDWRRDGKLTNVSILKSVHFAGGMRYDTGVTRDDGLFDVNVWEPAGRLALVRLAAGLYRGRFKRSPYARCERAGRVELRPDRARPLELDGEVTTVEEACLEVLPGALRLCS